MALVRVKHASIFRNGKKIAECYQNKYHIASGDEAAFGDDGFEGMTDGATTTTIDCTTIVPYGGMSVDLADDLLNKRDVDMTVGLVNGKIHEITMRVLEAEFDSDAKTGALNGAFKFMGGVPSVS